MNPNAKIYVAGHRGMVGSAIWRALKRKGCQNLVGRSSTALNLLDQAATESFFATERPEYVILAAARVGGIGANNEYRGQFIFENAQIELNVIETARRHHVQKLLFLGSSCIYPKLAPQPLKEEYLLTGPLEATNEPYAIAKIAGIRMCDAYNRQYGTNFITAMPTNLYGPGDNYDPETSHVLPALIRRFHDAKSEGLDHVNCWGTGKPLREFLYSDDLAMACLFLLENVDYSDLAFEDDSGTVHSHVNIGSGQEVSIRELAETVRDVVGFRGTIGWDPERPDGTPRKLLDSTRISKLGWRPEMSLGKGIARAYKDFLRQHTN
ncbi:MAG: GDP-L-fucose synthase [Gammaproteobacteria bacterium]|nr:GDP-L-fucose synthase [Gammaproteobacteria bacterium]